MPTLLADGAPTGAGLAIVAVILLAMLAVVLAVVILLARFVLRRVRGSGPADPSPPSS